MKFIRTTILAVVAIIIVGMVVYSIMRSDRERRD